MGTPLGGMGDGGLSIGLLSPPSIGGLGRVFLPDPSDPDPPRIPTPP
jgi:hypothetical protein